MSQVSVKAKETDESTTRVTRGPDPPATPSTPVSKVTTPASAGTSLHGMPRTSLSTDPSRQKRGASPFPLAAKRTRLSLADFTPLAADTTKVARLIQWEHLLTHTRRVHAQEATLAEQQLKQVFQLVQHKKRRRKDGYLALSWEDKEEVLGVLKECGVQLSSLAREFTLFRTPHLNFIRSFEQSLEQLEYKQSLFSNFDHFCETLQLLEANVEKVLQELSSEKVDEIREKVALFAANAQRLVELKNKAMQTGNELAFKLGLIRSIEWLGNPMQCDWNLSVLEALDAP